MELTWYFRKSEEGISDLSKSFSAMTEREKQVNRERLRHGLPADWVEEADATKMTDAEYRAALEEMARERRIARETANLETYLKMKGQS